MDNINGVNICKDHTGCVELRNVSMSDFIYYAVSVGLSTFVDNKQTNPIYSKYHINFAKYKGSIYASVESVSNFYVPPCKNFFKLGDIPIQLSEELNEMFNECLSKYVSHLRCRKLDEILLY